VGGKLGQTMIQNRLLKNKGGLGYFPKLSCQNPNEGRAGLERKGDLGLRHDEDGLKGRWTGGNVVLWGKRAFAFRQNRSTRQGRIGKNTPGS